jgi:hypothetical protein
VLVREFPIKKKRGRMQFPATPEFDAAPRMASQVSEGWSTPLLVPCSNPSDKRCWEAFVASIESWFHDTATDNRRFRMFGVFGCKEHPYRVDREFHGLMVYFFDYGDAVHMKLSLCHLWENLD